MILQNYYEYLKCFADRSSYFREGTVTNTKRFSDGSSMYAYCYDTHAIKSAFHNSFLKSWIGSGTADPVKTDWSLDQDETDNFSDILRTNMWRSVVVNGEARGQLDCKFSGKNNTSNPITITEIGITKHFASSSSGEPNMGRHYGILILREKLPTPITVQPQQVISLSLCWTM